MLAPTLILLSMCAIYGALFIAVWLLAWPIAIACREIVEIQ